MLLVSFSNPQYKKFEGKRMNEVIRRSKKPESTSLRAAENNNGSRADSLLITPRTTSLSLRQPWVCRIDGTALPRKAGWRGAIPIRDTSAPSPRAWRYVREEHVLNLEERFENESATPPRSTSSTGLLRPAWRRLTVFNAATIIDHATYEKPHQYATGREFVIVNGKVVSTAVSTMVARPVPSCTVPAKSKSEFAPICRGNIYPSILNGARSISRKIDVQFNVVMKSISESDSASDDSLPYFCRDRTGWYGRAPLC